MPPRDLDAIFYAPQPPSFEFRDGMFHVCFTIGRCRFEFAMSPHNFRKALRAATAIASEFERDSGKNVFVARPSDDDANGH